MQRYYKPRQQIHFAESLCGKLECRSSLLKSVQPSHSRQIGPMPPAAKRKHTEENAGGLSGSERRVEKAAVLDNFWRKKS